MRIVIDARNLLSTTGRYYERTLHYLQQIDNTNQYCLLLSSAGLKHWGSQDHPANFTAHKCDIAYFSLSEQRLLPGIIESFEPDLVHFTFQQKPLLIKSPYILTVFDLMSSVMKVWLYSPSHVAKSPMPDKIFSFTVNFSSRVGSCGKNPTFIFFAGNASPKKSLSRPAMIFSNEDFPDPLSPSTPILAP